MGNSRSKPESIGPASVSGIVHQFFSSSRTPQSVEELEICSDYIEGAPPEHGSSKVLMLGSLGLMEPPEVTQWQTYTEIYLMENRLTELPQDPRCPVLLVLFLNRNYKLRTFSPSFFDYMPALEILNLSRTRIKSLPESLFRLSRLKRLFLTHCEMLSVLPPKIGELQQLEVLDLEGTEIMDLPQEVAKLTKLTCLELSFCPRVNRGTKSAKANALIPQGTLSALSQLEELSIDVNPEDERWESVVEAIIDDVCGLISLDTLKLYLPRVEHLRKFKWFGTSMVCRLLSHFKFIVGSHDERIMSCLPVDLEFEMERWDRSLKYVNGVGVPIDIQKMLRHATAFFLDRHTDVTKLSDFGIANMEQLKCCIIGECNEIRVIIDGTDMYDEADRSEIVSETWEDDTGFLKSLEYLYVYHMKSLRCIYEGLPRRGSLSHLKCLALVTCPQLTTIFTPDLLKNLDSLEELTVEDCPHVSSLVTREDTPIDDSTYFLANMKRISLSSLPELISISSGLRIAPNLERMSIIDCPNLKSPSPDEICCNHLTGTKAQSIPNDASREQPAPTVVSYTITTTVNADSSTSKLKRKPKVASWLRKFKFNDLKLAAGKFSAASPLGKGGSGSVRGLTNEVVKVTLQLRNFSLEDLKLATRNFSPEGLLGQGGFGRVFKGWIEENGTAPASPGTGLTVAVKIFELSGPLAHGRWLAELSILGRLVHPNLVKLIGYCVEGNQGLLIYEYMQRGSLDNHLFESMRTCPLICAWCP
ncbi:disease resistance protein At4g27190-like isoform X2 [Eucalyptus grandis]|uniref:disease resistance protein At4g27190-like isoform X2 n=1 Tax=Eucalyptus grandis TaxID=71139 RepID=UPI00192EC7A4|nr:disease resistance protein At4g27190-like isoform X2 [Eucalyptus grandis]